MGYRLCTFDETGKLTSVSPMSVDSGTDTIFPFVALNPGTYSFLDESAIPAEVIDNLGDNSEMLVVNDGVDVRARNPVTVRSLYDPRADVTLLMPNPLPYFVRGTNLIQDLTKVTAVNNAVAPETKPIHSDAVYKFPPTSVKFTKSTGGYTGGYLYITNLSKLARNTAGGETAPHNNIGVGLTYSWAVELFFYPTGSGSNFTLLQKGPSGTAANWKLGYDSSAGQLQFAWQSYGVTSGYNYTQNLVNTAGMTSNTWHHVAVALVRTGSGLSYQLSGYFNGANKFTLGITNTSTTPEVRYNGGLYVGNTPEGTESFAGYIDSLRILESPGTGGLFGPSGYGFLPYGSGNLALPTLTGFTRSAQSAAILNFNNRPNTSDFYVESLDFIAGVVTHIKNFTLDATGVTGYEVSEVGVKDVVRWTIGYTAGATGYSDPTGFTTNYGAVCSPFTDTTPSGSTSTLHGYDHAFPINAVHDNNPSLNVYQVNYRNDLRYDFGLEMLTMIEGIAGNRGSCGSIFTSQFGQNPFRRLFNGLTGACGNCYGVGLAHNSLFINPADTTTMNYIMNNGYLVTQGLTEPAYSFVDGRGLTRTVTATDISNLRLDIMEYQNKIVNGYRATKTSIDAAATPIAVKLAKKNKTYSNTLSAGFDAEILGGKDSGGSLSLE
jgi:hypothetical protein